MAGPFLNPRDPEALVQRIIGLETSVAFLLKRLAALEAQRLYVNANDVITFPKSPEGVP